MLPLFLALAAAASPLPDHPGPYRIDQSDGSDLHVYDGLGQRVPTEVVLRAVEGDAVADQYTSRRGGRKAAAVLMWIGGGVAATAGTLGLGGEPGLLVGLGAASTGAGFLTLYAPRSNRLDQWTTEEALHASLGAMPSGGPFANPAPAYVIESWTLVDGVPTASGEAVSVPDLAATLGEARVADEWERWRQSRRRTRTGLLIAGAALTVGGLTTAASNDDPDTYGAGIATASVGCGMMLGGTVAFAAPGPRGQASAWFTPEELDEAVRLHNAGPPPLPATSGAVTPPRPPLLTVAPTIGLGYAGLHGTF